jgi:hypothetical protein
MHEQREPVGRAVRLALELAETGAFENITAIERELAAVGYPRGDIQSLERPGVRIIIDAVCSTGRRRSDHSGE